MAEPYIRIGTMFASVLLGAIVVVATEAPAVFMAPIIVLKIVVETIMHLREHTPPATTR